MLNILGGKEDIVGFPLESPDQATIAADKTYMSLQDAGVVHEILYLTQSQRERDDCSCIYHAIKS